MIIPQIALNFFILFSSRQLCYGTKCYRQGSAGIDLFQYPCQCRIQRNPFSSIKYVNKNLPCQRYKSWKGIVCYGATSELLWNRQDTREVFPLVRLLSEVCFTISNSIRKDIERSDGNVKGEYIQRSGASQELP